MNTDSAAVHPARCCANCWWMGVSMRDGCTTKWCTYTGFETSETGVCDRFKSNDRESA